MKKDLMSLKTTTGWGSILLIPGIPEDKEKMPARLLTALTVLFLIFAGSPLANLNTNMVNAETNPYAQTGSIIVNTNNTAANFTLIGPTTYAGNGTAWSQSDAPEGTYNITFDPIPGYDTPANDTQTLVSGGTITFTGLYNLSVGTITVTTDNTAATFNITGPATYSGSGTTWSRSEAPIGTYTITFDPIPGYDTPASDTRTLVSGGAVDFTGLYIKTIYTLTLQASADSHISEWNQNARYGNETTMGVRSFFQGTNKNGRSLIKFNTLPIPAGSTIISATLRLNASNVPTALRNYKINRVEQSWDESNVTWNNRPSTASSATSFASTPSLPGMMSWIVTPDTQDWVNGSPNYGWQISDQSEDSSTQYTTMFYTKEYSDTSLMPALVVQYTTV